MATYDALHRQCRTLESLFDSKLTSYARLASAIVRNQDDVESSGSRERWQDLQSEVEDLLEKLRETNDALLAFSTNPDSIPPQAVARVIQRHREVYQDYARELERTKANIQHGLEQANLLTGVRNDIDAYKSSVADSLLGERSRIDNSHRMTDDVLEYAAAASSQRAIFNLPTDKRTRQGLNSLVKVVHWRASTRGWQASSLATGCLPGHWSQRFNVVSLLECLPVVLQSPHSTPILYSQVLYPCCLDGPSLNFSNNQHHFPCTFGALLDRVIVRFDQDTTRRACFDECSVLGKTPIDHSGQRHIYIWVAFLRTMSGCNVEYHKMQNKYLYRSPSLYTEPTTVEIDADALPLGIVFLMHSIQEIQSSLTGLDAMNADVSAKLNCEINLWLKDG
ncbi:hypothetical protein J3R82DRAFT_529 [Butyriboletus roseoflavus]|nr:hypothetical protein J3R82DRAFT_529 [Butyriboletus roseoflavus]